MVRALGRRLGRRAGIAAAGKRRLGSRIQRHARPPRPDARLPPPRPCGHLDSVAGISSGRRGGRRLSPGLAWPCPARPRGERKLLRRPRLRRVRPALVDGNRRRRILRHRRLPARRHAPLRSRGAVRAPHLPASQRELPRTPRAGGLLMVAALQRGSPGGVLMRNLLRIRRGSAGLLAALGALAYGPGVGAAAASPHLADFPTAADSLSPATSPRDSLSLSGSR